MYRSAYSTCSVARSQHSSIMSSPPVHTALFSTPAATRAASISIASAPTEKRAPDVWSSRDNTAKGRVVRHPIVRIVKSRGSIGWRCVFTFLFWGKQIGRASCRERVEGGVGAGAVGGERGGGAEWRIE